MIANHDRTTQITATIITTIATTRVGMSQMNRKKFVSRLASAEYSNSNFVGSPFGSGPIFGHLSKLSP
ncbi:MAG: hypothetical protein EBS22_04685 [Acidimicrobiia bacterium]|nr:hypothetical protein [Acidimicrobiia bacterium]